MVYNMHGLEWLQRNLNYNYLVCKQTLNNLAKLASLAKWLSVCLQTRLLWVRVPLQSLKFQISHLFWARGSLTFRQSQSADLLCVCDMIKTHGSGCGYSEWTSNFAVRKHYSKSMVQFTISKNLFSKLFLLFKDVIS